jgi:predicted permease
MAHLGNRFLRWIFRGRRHDDIVAEEMRHHLELRRQALIDDGWDPRAARDEAQRMFGNTARLREEARDMWGFRTFDDLAHDVRYGARYLGRSPVFTLVAVVSVAVAIGAGAAIFAITNAVAFRPIGVGDGETLYRVFTSGRDGGLYGGSSYPDYLSFAEARDIFSATCAVDNVAATITTRGDAALHTGELVSPDCFEALRIRPAYGRFFNTASLAETPSPIVIGHGIWTRRFSADPAAIGQSVVVNGTQATIVAVAPRGFAGTSLDGSAEFWAPIGFAGVMMPPGTLEDRGHRRFNIYARLREGIDRPRAEAALAVIASQLRRVDERTWQTADGGTRRVTVMQELEARFAQAPDVLWLTFGSGMAAVALIIGIACVNLATMLLARGAARARELSIRLALGASRGRVVRQLATESLMVSVAGSVIGVGLVAVALRIAADYRPQGAPAFDVALDWRVLLFSVATAVFASLLFGLAPAAHALKLAIAEGMKAPSSVRRVRRLRVGPREALIVLQVTASVALLIVSTLFVRASMSAGTLNPGFNGQSVVTLRIGFEALDSDVVPGLTARLLEAAQRVRGVEHASLAQIVPLAGERMGFFATIDDGKKRDYFGNIVSPGYFAALRIPLVAGRDFEVRDGANAARVAIVSETFARQAWQTPANTVGRVMMMENQPVTIVGVAGDIRYFLPTEPYQALLYLPIAQVTPYRTTVHARVNGDGATIAALERALRSVDARVAIEPPTSLSGRIDATNAPERVMRWVGAGAGGVQLILALMALWGLVAYAVERRSAEWGLRVALGATPASLVRLSVRPAAVLIVTGVVVGTAVGAVATEIMRSSGMSQVAIDARAVVPLAVVFTIVALTAAWWPARKAGLADPASLLRRE